MLWYLIYFIYLLVCHQYHSTLSFRIISVTLQISLCIFMMTKFLYFLIRLLFPASNSVSMLICRVTAFRFKICVNKSPVVIIVVTIWKYHYCYASKQQICVCTKRKIGCGCNVETNSLLLIVFCVGCGDLSDLVIQD